MENGNEILESMIRGILLENEEHTCDIPSSCTVLKIFISRCVNSSGTLSI